MIDWVGPALIGVGGALMVLSGVAERYHSRQFAEHFDRLERFAEADDYDAVGNEVRRFHDDWRVAFAADLMAIGSPVGMFAIVIGGVLLLQ